MTDFRVQRAGRIGVAAAHARQSFRCDACVDQQFFDFVGARLSAVTVTCVSLSLFCFTELNVP